MRWFTGSQLRLEVRNNAHEEGALASFHFGLASNSTLSQSDLLCFHSIVIFVGIYSWLVLSFMRCASLTHQHGVLEGHAQQALICPWLHCSTASFRQCCMLTKIGVHASDALLRLSDSKHCALTLDAVEYACVVDGDVLLGDDLDDLLRHNAASQGGDVVQLSPSSTSAVVLSATFRRTRISQDLQFLGELPNPCLNRRVVRVFDTSLGFVYQIIHNLMSNASELLGVCVCNGLVRCLRCAT